MLVVRGHEDDVDPPGQRARRLDAIHARHADVEERDVGLVGLHGGDGLVAVGRLRDDHELRPRLLQPADQLVAHQALVVGDDGGRGGCLVGHAARLSQTGAVTTS